MEVNSGLFSVARIMQNSCIVRCRVFIITKNVGKFCQSPHCSAKHQGVPVVYLTDALHGQDSRDQLPSSHCGSII